jgi:hypothetical protein
MYKVALALTVFAGAMSAAERQVTYSGRPFTARHFAHL